MAKPVYAQAYIYGGDPDYNLCKDGSNFEYSNIFALVGNHAIKPHEKSYFEITISEYAPVTNLKYIPVFVGITKEPATGVLSNDFIIGSIYCTKADGKFEIQERNNHNGQYLSHTITNITAPIPVKDDVIGVGIDYDANTITIYRTGLALYTFSPTTFTLNGNDAFYPCVYYSVNNKYIKGNINQGSCNCQFTPSGFLTIYQAHNVPELPDLDITPSVIGIKRFDITLQSSLAQENTITDNVKFKLTDRYQGYIHSSHPYPNDYKIYTEVYVRGGILIPSVLGIPISIGFIDYTAPLGDALATYIKIPLWHRKQQKYEYTTSIHGVKDRVLIDNVLTSVPSEQGTYIGIGLNPERRTITVWIGKELFYVYPINFDFEHKKFHLFISNDSIYKNNLIGNVNFGDYITTIPFLNHKPNMYLSLSDYYRNGNLNYISNEIIGEIEVTDMYFKHHKDIECILQVQGNDTSYEGNGLNYLMDTYTEVLDREPHYIDPEKKDQAYLVSLVKSKNNGFNPFDNDDLTVDE